MPVECRCWPCKLFIPLGFSLIFAQMLSELIKCVALAAHFTRKTTMPRARL